MERPWHALVRALRDTAYESPYLDRLRVRHDVAAAQDQLEKEIVREMAEALGRSGEKVAAALRKLELAARALAAARDDEEHARLVDAFNARRDDALKARHELRIHREAIGIRRNEMLEREYPIPPKLR